LIEVNNQSLYFFIFEMTPPPSSADDIQVLRKHIQRLGQHDAQTGRWRVAFGVLFRDDEVANTLEALLGTLKAAKKKKKREALTARGVGHIVRNELQLEVGERRGNGFPVFWDNLKLEALAKRFGIPTEGVMMTVKTRDEGQRQGTAGVTGIEGRGNGSKEGFVPPEPEMPPATQDEMWF
jgi:hypothetical protein